MSLLQIAEPNQSAQPHQHRFGLGIDLGTTRSLVAVVRSGKAQVLEASAATDTLLPSVVYYPSVGKPLVGSDALAHLADDPKIRSSRLSVLWVVVKLISNSLILMS